MRKLYEKMEALQAYRTIEKIAWKYAHNIEYYEAIIIENIAYEERIIQSQKIVLYIKQDGFENEVIGNFCSEKDLFRLWEYCIKNLTKEKCFMVRNNNRKYIFQDKIETECRRLAYAKEMLKKNKSTEDIIKWCSECQLYMNSNNEVGMFENHYYGIEHKSLKGQEYQTYGKKMDECYQDLNILKQINEKKMKNLEDAEIFLVSPQVVCDLIVIPFNQIINIGRYVNESILDNIPKCLTLGDIPHSERSINNLQFDILGNRVKNNIHIRRGELKSEERKIRNVTLHKNTLKYSMIFPSIGSGSWSIEEIMKLEYQQISGFVGKFNLSQQRISGKIILEESQKSGLKEISVDIAWEKLMNSIIGFSREKIIVNRILKCECPYMLIKASCIL